MASSETIFGIMDKRQAEEIAREYGTPVYVYSESLLEKAAQEVLTFPHAYGLTARYAMKALPTRRIIQLFHQQGLHIDASSFYEVQRARKAGIPAPNILLTAQEFPSPQLLRQFIELGGKVNACSLNQLEILGDLKLTESEYGLRINPGQGSGACNKVKVGGSSSSFGIWHEDLTQAKDIINDHSMNITRLHTHIGSGTDPKVWKGVAQKSLSYAKQFPQVHTFNVGGGFKVARMLGEEATNLQECGNEVRKAFVAFYSKTTLKLHLEIEPGTYLVANAGAVITTVLDEKSTDKYHFVILNSGMTEVARPVLYGAQHPLHIISQGSSRGSLQEYLVAGHCCESGDTWTTPEGGAEGLLPRKLPQAREGDLLVIGGAGAYCSGMNMAGYNSFPQATEVLLRKDGKAELIRRRQTLEQMIQNEVL